MRLSDLLFQLVHSLTRAEIQAFKERTGHRGTGKYLRLFDVIAEMDEPDEVLIKKRFKGDPILNNVSVAKNYLYKSILDSMARSHHDEESELQTLVQKIKFLIDKGLYQHAKILLPEAEALAASQEDFNMHLLVLEYERTSLTLLHQNLGALNRLSEIRQKERDLAKKIRVLQKFQHTLDLVYESHSRPDRLKRIAQSTFLQNNKPINSLRAEILSGTVHFSIARFLGQTSDCIARLKEIVQLFEAHPHFLADQNSLVKYMDALNNLAHFFLLAGKFKEGVATGKKIISISEKMKRAEVVAFERYYPVMMAYVLAKGDHELGVKLVGEIDTGKEQLRGRIQKRQEVVLDFYVSLVMYQVGNREDCQRYLNRIIYHAEPDIRSDLQCVARLIQLIIYIDQHDWVSLETQLPSFRRFLKTKNFFPAATGAFFTFARRYNGIDSPKEAQQLVDGLRESLGEIYQNEEERMLENYFELSKWVKEGNFLKPSTRNSKKK
jgi:hypothetical protein